MRELAGKAMEDGAWGMSTGLIYVPSSYASTDELVAIAEHNPERRRVVGETQQLRPLPAIDDIGAPAGAIGSSLVLVSDMHDHLRL